MTQNDAPSRTIGVIIPAFKSAATIVEALASVSAQTVSASEIVIVNDASPDNTVEVISAWLKDQGHVRQEHEDSGVAETVTYAASEGEQLVSVVSLKENGGPARARNIGIRRSSGSWIAFLDADDAWLPHKLAVQLAFAEKHPDVALICSTTIGIGTRTTSQGDSRGKTSRRLSLCDFVDHNPIATSTVLLTRNAFEATAGFDEQFRGPEDYDFWVRVLSQQSAVLIDEPLSQYRHAVGSLSMDDRTFLPQVVRVLAKAYGPGGALEGYKKHKRRAYAEQYASAAWMAHNRGANGVALRYLLRSWAYDVRRIYKEKKDPLLRIKVFVRYLTNRKPDVEGRVADS